MIRRLGGVTRGEFEAVRRDLERTRAEATTAEATLTARCNAAEAAAGELTRRLATLEDLQAIAALERWTRHVGLVSSPLISVVMPTLDRADHLRRAIASIVMQRYQEWELLIVDDGGTEDSRAVSAAFDDPRIRWTGVRRGGVCAARNAALALASGDLVAYLDDDNVMDPNWLFSVAWAFEQRPEIDVLYGAFVIDDVLRVNRRSAGALPQVFLHPWDRDAIRGGNLADISAIAHRRGLPGAVFDETLREMGDWDLLLSLTTASDPLVLPAIACYYTTDAPNRLSGGHSHDEDRQRVMARAAGRS